MRAGTLALGGGSRRRHRTSYDGSGVCRGGALMSGVGMNRGLVRRGRVGRVWSGLGIVGVGSSSLGI